MKNKIQEEINKHHAATGGKCGISIVKLSNRLNENSNKITELITEMYNDDEVDVRTGINEYLIFKKPNKAFRRT